MLKPRYRSNQLICGIDSSPFTVVLLVVVVTLLVINLIIPQPYHSYVGLPRVGHPISMWQADQREAMLIAIQRDGKMYIGRDPVVAESLPPRIREGLARGAERKIYIKADAQVKYGYVKEVIDGVHDAGVEKIGFIAEQRTKPARIP